MAKKTTTERIMKRTSPPSPKKAVAPTKGATAIAQIREQMASFTDGQRSALHVMWKEVFFPSSNSLACKK